jgi:hypothetical protein
MSKDRHLPLSMLCHALSSTSIHALVCHDSFNTVLAFIIDRHAIVKNKENPHTKRNDTDKTTGSNSPDKLPSSVPKKIQATQGPSRVNGSSRS